MALELMPFIDAFSETNPVGSQDFMAEGDDHIRRMKAAIKATFPFMDHRAWSKRAVSASGPVNQNDNMRLIRTSNALTLTPADASVLGDGWLTFIRADNGTVTVDPAQPINGAASKTIPTGYTGILFSDGTEFYLALMYSEVPVTVKPFPVGTRMVFHQTSAPIGWTKLTSAPYNNATMRMTTGTVGTGGIDDFTTTFGSGKSTAGFSLTASHNGPHDHTGGRTANATGVGPGWGADPSAVLSNPVNTGSSGSGSSHSHNLNNMNPKYIDCIVASID